MLPTVPTVPLGAIKEGILHAMGAANARPASEIVTQMMAIFTLFVSAAPAAAGAGAGDGRTGRVAVAARW